MSWRLRPWVRDLYAWACWLHAAWWIKRYGSPTCSTMEQHQCHICRNETTGYIDAEYGCETCALDFADSLD